MTFADWLLEYAVRPMVESVIHQGDHFTIRVIQGPGSPIASEVGDVTQIVHGSDLMTLRDSSPSDLHWARVTLGEEALEYALGAPSMSREALNQHIQEFADELESWISNTAVGWGELRPVARVNLGQPNILPDEFES